MNYGIDGGKKIAIIGNHVGAHLQPVSFYIDSLGTAPTKYFRVNRSRGISVFSIVTSLYVQETAKLCTIVSRDLHVIR